MTENPTAETRTIDDVPRSESTATDGHDISSGQRRLVELSHVIRAGTVTLPNLPAPEIEPHLSRTDSAGHYAPGTTFEINRISMVGNTGTYLDSPYHRFEDGNDLSHLTLERLVDLPAVVVRARPGTRAVGIDQLEGHQVRDKAVLIHTGDDARFGTPEYVEEASFLTRDGAAWLVERGAVLVGIDSANIDDMSDGTRPAHTLLLGAQISVVEHLTGLEGLPDTGSLFTAVPPRLAEVGTFPVRAFASVAS